MSDQDKKRSISNRDSYSIDEDESAALSPPPPPPPTSESAAGGAGDQTLPRYVNADAYKLATLEEKQLHAFQVRFFFRPVLCAHCRDYLWGPGHIGYACTGCACCVHTKCYIFVAKASCARRDGALNELAESTLAQNFSIEQWSVDHVKEWLAVVNLHRYAELFSINKIDGKRLLRLDSNQLLMYRIRDSYHHRVIFECRDELVYRSRQYATFPSMKNEQSAYRAYLVQNPYKADRHFFLLHTIAYQVKCHVCARPFLGIVHQAMLCQNCGLMVHRQCACNGLPDCTKASRPRFVPTKHFIFGVSLFDFAAGADGGAGGGGGTEAVPPLLVKALETIERRAYSSHEDLYDVYRLSSDTSKIEQIKAQLNENGVELTQFDRYDLNTIAAIVKSFLRDLQDSVIPEELYDKLIECVESSSSQEFQTLIKNSLHPQHYACLKFIMAHLVRVWTYQYLFHNCRYLPDKIFHIFRSILIRPPWEKITKIVYNIDRQSLIIQRLMLECDWGVEIPEYKQRPAKPPLPPQITIDSPDVAKTDLKQLAFAMKESASQLGSQIEALSAAAMLSQPKSFNAPRENLIEVPWYWPDLNRDDTILVLKNCPDGSFLVRNSTDKSESSPFTLCVVKSSLIKSIKIFREEFDAYPDTCLYDIEKPCRFETLQALVSYYSNISLKEYNHNLDIILTNGVSKYKFGKTTEWTTEKLYSSFKSVYVQLEEATKKCDELEARLQSVRDEIGQKDQAVKAFTKILDLYRKQENDASVARGKIMLRQAEESSTSKLLAAQLLPKNLFGPPAVRYVDPESASEMNFETMMSENKDKLATRIRELVSKKTGVEESISSLKAEETQLQEQLDLLKPELIELRKKRENYHMWLLQRGENDDKIQTVLKPSRINSDEKTAKTGAAQQLSLPTMKASVSMSNLDDIDGSSASSIRVPNSNARLNLPATLAAAAALSSSMNMSGSVSTESLNKSPKLSPRSFASSHLNSLNWYKADCDREQAVQILKSRPNGTYLVRPSSNQNSKYVVSLVHNDQIKHLLIEEDKQGCYLKSSSPPRLMTVPMISPSANRSRSPSASSMLSTQDLLHYSSSESSSLNTSMSGVDAAAAAAGNTSGAEPGFRFKTLTELVTHYSANSLKTVNPSIDITLLHPAFYNQQS